MGDLMPPSSRFPLPRSCPALLFPAPRHASPVFLLGMSSLIPEVARSTPNGPGATTSRSEKTRFVRKCHKLSVTRGRVCVERRKEYGGAAADDRDHGGEAHGSGSSDC